MQKNVKTSLLLLTLFFVLVLSISSAFAHDINNSTDDLAVYNDNEIISIDNQDDGYDDLSVVDDADENSRAADGVSVGSDDEKLGYTEPNPSAYFKFDKEDFTITEGETITVKAHVVDGSGEFLPGPDFLVYIQVNGGSGNVVELSGHEIVYTFPNSLFVASETPYNVTFTPEDGPMYWGDWVSDFGGPEVSTSWFLVTVNSNNPQPTSLTEAYVDYDNGLDTNGGTASAPFKTIGHALSVVEDNGVVYLADGVHYLDGVDVDGLNILKNVSIIGMTDDVVIDARNSGRILKIQGNNVLLSNIIFKNGNVSSA
ncbi:MAG: DUF1565 domain-containing protein, partial [Methanobrevibacter sp.]|uniref:DUF1565 domain-containing protein n=1 Tax=Methanobrevibacter sp. TaxID=66852 RepID=UPI0025F74763